MCESIIPLASKYNKCEMIIYNMIPLTIENHRTYLACYKALTYLEWTTTSYKKKEL